MVESQPKYYNHCHNSLISFLPRRESLILQAAFDNHHQIIFTISFPDIKQTKMNICKSSLKGKKAYASKDIKDQ